MEKRQSSAYPDMAYYYCACGMIGTNPEYHICMRKGESLSGEILEKFKNEKIT